MKPSAPFTGPLYKTPFVQNTLSAQALLYSIISYIAFPLSLGSSHDVFVLKDGAVWDVSVTSDAKASFMWD